MVTFMFQVAVSDGFQTEDWNGNQYLLQDQMTRMTFLVGAHQQDVRGDYTFFCDNGRKSR